MDGHIARRATLDDCCAGRSMDPLLRDLPSGVGVGRRSVVGLPVRALVAAAVAAVLLASCGEGGMEGEVRPAGGFVAPMKALCEARDRAESGDIAAAEEAFFDSVHAPLHQLAAEAGEVDREAAGSLLEAKFRVEEALSTTGQAPELSRALDELAREAAVAAEATGEAVRPCEQ